MLIYLIRHVQSRSNVDKKVHYEMADHEIPASDEGLGQGIITGEMLNEELHRMNSARILGDANVRMWLSPYKRTRQTADIIETQLDSYWLNGGRREHIALCEQSFGLFDGVPNDELPVKFPKEHAHYKKFEEAGGRFWAPMPLGERRFDVAMRVHHAFGTFQRDYDKHGINTLVIVSHGVTIRAFIMMWLHKSWEWMEAEPNPGNGSITKIYDGAHKVIFPGYDRKGDLSSPVWP